MKKQYLPAKMSLLLVIALTGAIAAYAQKDKTDKVAEIKNLVESQRYVFRAQSAMPMSGQTRQLTSEYDLKVTKDTIVSYLPYFGRAYTAPVDPSQGGIQFTSTLFEYTIAPHKKGGWDVAIKPKDNRDVQQMMLNISEAGYASLQVTSINRQPISFSGYITAIKPGKKK